MPSPCRRRPLTGSTKGTSGTLPRTWLNERFDEEIPVPGRSGPADGPGGTVANLTLLAGKMNHSGPTGSSIADSDGDSMSGGQGTLALLAAALQPKSLLPALGFRPSF